MQLAGAEKQGVKGKGKKGKGKGKENAKGKGRGGRGKKADEPVGEEVPEPEVKDSEKKKRASPKSTAEPKTKRNKVNQRQEVEEKKSDEDIAPAPKPKAKRAKKTPPSAPQQPEEPQEDIVEPPAEVIAAPALDSGDQVVADIRAQIREWGNSPVQWTALCNLFTGMYGDITPSNAPKLTHYTLSMYWKKGRVGLVHKPTKKHVLSYCSAGTGKIGLPLQACLRYAISSDPTCFLMRTRSTRTSEQHTHKTLFFYQVYALILKYPLCREILSL